jgi:hypothetical protein
MSNNTPQGAVKKSGHRKSHDSASSNKVTVINSHLKIFVALQDLTLIESSDRILAASPKPTPGLSSNRKAIDNSLSPAILLASEKKCLKYPIQKHPTELREVPWTI